MVKASVTRSTWAWWAAKRLRYNIGFAIAGILAFACYCAVFELGLIYFPEKMGVEFEITLFTIAFQAFGYLVIIGLANVCYFLGPVSERVLGPKDADRYRRVCFGLGFWFSVILPFAFPVILAARIIR